MGQGLAAPPPAPRPSLVSRHDRRTVLFVRLWRLLASWPLLQRRSCAVCEGDPNAALGWGGHLALNADYRFDTCILPFCRVGTSV